MVRQYSILPVCLYHSTQNHVKYINIHIRHPWSEMQNALRAGNCQVLKLSYKCKFYIMNFCFMHVLTEMLYHI